ncbi:hypothetical protein [Streptosporangium subroseum]|uniref:hypothetical protein n=1 Tax=Streptosporangium subroseum TaxID=106412 RepID=UPI0030917192|nr:hypothetical protein OHB15_24555 [Streptosporangium subroseum]
MDIYPAGPVRRGFIDQAVDRLIASAPVLAVTGAWGVIGWVLRGWAGAMAGVVAGLIVTGIIGLLIYRWP